MVHMFTGVAEFETITNVNLPISFLTYQLSIYYFRLYYQPTYTSYA